MDRPKKIRESGQSRTASLYNYIEVARFLGVDPYPILKDAKIPVSALANPETWIASASILKVYLDTERASGCEHFGLLMAECRSLSHMGPLSMLIQHQPTARDILFAFTENWRLINETLIYRLEDDGETALICADLPPGYGVRSTAEAAVATIYRAINEIMAGRWLPECIHFRHAPPKDLTAHRRIFRCPVQFDSDFDGISCSSDALDIENPGKNPDMLRHARRFLDILAIERPKSTVIDRTRHAICLLLNSSDASLEKVADNLGRTARQLQRELDTHGTSFYELLNETRRELAVRYITTSGHSILHISELLGYSNQSAFTRWFVSEFAITPLKWRMAYQQEEGFLPSAASN